MSSQQNKQSYGKNYYQILGLKDNASQKQIEDAYKKLSKQWYPDQHKDNKKQAQYKFNQINQAYDVLSNHNVKHHYDQLAHKPYTDKDADQTFQKFYKEHGFQDDNQKKFFETHYPHRKRSPYQILGVSRNATQQDIDNAYRRLALEYHPKNNNESLDSRRIFNEINEAYNHIRNDSRRHSYDSMSFGQITPFRAYNIFDNFWGDKWHQLDEDDFFRPILRTKWSKNLDKALKQGFNQDWGTTKDGESQRISTFYTNKNGVESKKTVSSKTRYENGIPKTETTEQYQFPDGKKQVRQMLDDGQGNVTSNVYHLKKGEILPIRGA